MDISIIEDEKILVSNIAKKLKRNWYNPNIFTNTLDFKNSINYKADLYIVDLSLWDWNWFDIIKRLRNQKKSSAPIIITSWFNSIEKKVYGLDIWADDYLAKPFSPEELLARIRALLRRNKKITRPRILKYNDIELDLNAKEVKLWWVPVYFTLKELLMIELFMLNKWCLISKTRLIESVWWANEIINVSDNNINVTISKIRKKLWDDFRLETIINWWYILKDEKNNRA